MKKNEPKSWLTNDCSSGKRAFNTRADARAVASRRRRKGVPRLSVYLCEECQKYHMGHLPRPVVRGEVPRSEIRQPGILNPKRHQKPPER